MTISKITPPSTLAGAPYHDDWDETKGYKRILFKPGFAVQARELNQLQTTLQAELDYLGQYNFQSGSKLVGGISRRFSRPYVKLGGDDLGAAAYSDWIGTVITGGNSGVTAIVKSVEYVNNDTDVLYVEYTNTGTDNETHAFDASETITSSASGAPTAEVHSAAGTGVGSFITIEEGVYYYNGYYIFVEEQTLLLNPYDNDPAYMVGYTVSETIVTSATDTSLLDNAADAPNETAPGADRLAITATISKLELDVDDTTDDGFVATVDVPDNWFSHSRVRGEQPIEPQDPIYQDNTPLSDRLEQRTYEESGNYILTPFPINVTEHKQAFWSGRYNDGFIAGGDVDKYRVAVQSDNKTAYVKGRRISFNNDRDIIVEKPRDADSRKTFSSGKSIGITLGKYFLVKNMYGLPAVDNHGVRWRNRLWNKEGNRIGSCRVRGIEADPSDTGEDRYRVYVWDVLMREGGDANQAVAFIASEAPNAHPQGWGNTVLSSPGDSPLTVTNEGAGSQGHKWYCEITNTRGGHVGKLKHGKQNTIFKLPVSNVATLLDSSNADNTVYRARVSLKATAVTSGTITFTLPANTTLDNTNDLFYSIQKTDTDPISLWSKVKALSDAGTPRYDGTVNGGAGPAGTNTINVIDTVDADAETARLVVTIKNDKNVRKYKSKTKKKLFQDTLTFVTGTKKYYLRYPDVTRLRLVYSELTTTTTSVNGTGFTKVTEFAVDDVAGIKVNDLVLSTANPSDGSIIRPTFVQKIDGTTITVDKPVTLSNDADIMFKEIVDHTYKFSFHNGQTTSSYGLASITRLDGPVDGSDVAWEDTIEPGANNLKVLFDYFEHGTGGDYFSVDSYTGGDITSYSYREIGHIGGYKLRDCLDFRPAAIERDASWGGFFKGGQNQMEDLCPAPGYTIELGEPTVYLPRKDRLWLTKDRQFIYQKGVPAQVGGAILPPLSQQPADAMLLYDIKVNPYVYNVKTDIEFYQANNQRYTMRQLRGIGSDLEQLRFYVGQNLNRIGRGGALGPADNPREEMGMATDYFAGPMDGGSLADPGHPDFFVGYNVDGTFGSITAPHHRPANGATLVIDGDESASKTAVVENGVATAKLNVSTPYLNEIVQNRSTRNIAINSGGNTNTQHGIIILQPSSDVYGSDLYTQPAFTEYTYSGSMAPWQMPTTWVGDAAGLYDPSDAFDSEPGVDLNGSNQNGGWGFNEGRNETWNSSKLHAASQVFRVMEDDGTIQRKVGENIWEDVQYLETKNLTDGVINVRLDFANSFTDIYSGHNFGWGVNTAHWTEPGYHSYIPSGSGGGASGITDTMRSRLVYFHASGLRPGAKVIPWLGWHNVSDYCKEISEAVYLANKPGDMTDSDEPFEEYVGDTFISDGGTGVSTAGDLKADGTGTIWGVMLIPSNHEISLERGGVQFVLSSDTVHPFNPRPEYTYARAMYYSDERGKPMSANSITQNTVTMAEASAVNATVTSTDHNTGALAQTFKIQNKLGAFVKKLTLYFSSKPADSGAAPVQVRITGTKNVGYGRLVPNSRVLYDATIKNIEWANVDDDVDGEDTTVVEFDHPVWLGGDQEYAIHLSSNSADYSLRIARAGQQQTETGGGIHARMHNNIKNLWKQSDTGHGGWDRIEGAELKFKLERCNFVVGDSRLDLCNGQVPATRLDPNPFECIAVDNGSTPKTATLRVYHPNHGMYNGVADDGSPAHSVRFSGCGIGPTGITGLKTNYIAADELNYFGSGGAATAFTVSNQTLHTYEITVPYAGTTNPNLWVRAGYNSVRAKGNIMYDYFKPKLGQLWPEGTNVKTYLTKTTTGEGISSKASVTLDENTVVREISNSSWNIMDDPGIILSAQNQNIGAPAASGKSLKMKVMLNTDNARVSPIVILNESEFRTHQNLINTAENSAGTPHTPLDSVAFNTATVAKYITKRIDVLAIDNALPTALDIWMNVNQPEGSSVEVWYKTDVDNIDTAVSDADTDVNAGATEDAWNNLGWTQIVHESANLQAVIDKGFRMSIDPLEIPTSDDPADVDYDDMDEDNWPLVHYEIQDTTDGSDEIPAFADYSDRHDAAFVFNSYAIKIVLKSNNTANVPSVRNLVIAASRHVVPYSSAE